MQARRRLRAMAFPRCRPPRYQPRSRAIPTARPPPARASQATARKRRAPKAAPLLFPAVRAGPANTRCSGTDQVRASRGGTRQRSANPARCRRRVPGPVHLGSGWGAGPDLPRRRPGQRVGAEGLLASLPSPPSTELCNHHPSSLEIPSTRRGPLGRPANSGWSQEPSGRPQLALGPNPRARPASAVLPAQ